MESNYLSQITHKINACSKRYNLGDLQKLRKDILGLKRLASQDIFTSTTTFDNWAFHYGGRKELQFNIGLESLDSGSEIRFGVAFSLECSQSLPNIEILLPRIALFNDYMQSNPDSFADMRMWHYQGNRSTDYSPSSIPPELIKEGVFIFLGIRQPIDHLDYEAGTKAMDRLLPLYLYTESGGKIEYSRLHRESWKFHFKAGCTPKASSANASLAKKQLDIQLRHNDIQTSLYQKLSEKYGCNNIGTELSSGNGTSVDLVVKCPEEYWFYEIKTAHTAKACIRQAIGQLLEYSYWPNNQEATRLVIVGEPSFDEEAKRYLEILKARFSLPLEYESVEI
jgi:hypothetical protein